MSVCDPNGGMHELYTGFLPKHLFADAPTCVITSYSIHYTKLYDKLPVLSIEDLVAYIEHQQK